MAIAERQPRVPVLVGEKRDIDWSKALCNGAVAALRIAAYLILILIFLIPFIWMIFGSVRDEKEIFQYLYPLSWHTFFPIHWTTIHYEDILGISDAGKRAGLNFGRNLANSFIVSTAVVICSLLFNTMGVKYTV